MFTVITVLAVLFILAGILRTLLAIFIGDGTEGATTSKRKDYDRDRFYF